VQAVEIRVYLVRLKLGSLTLVYPRWAGTQLGVESHPGNHIHWVGSVRVRVIRTRAKVAGGRGLLGWYSNGRASASDHEVI